jgi:hypothetical protein
MFAPGPGRRKCREVLVTRRSELTVSRIVRMVFGTATVSLLVVAFVVGREPRLFAAAAAFGAIWWSWDLLLEHVFQPLGDWIVGTLASGGIGMSDPTARPTLDELVRLLENHLARGSSRQVDLNAAIRLEEIYRTVKRDPEGARRVIALVLERYPDAPELQQFRGAGGAGEGVAPVEP